LALLLAFGGCTSPSNGDFGRLNPSYVSDDIHDWVGRRAAYDRGRLPSAASLTEDERQLRDLAYPLIEPPFDRGRFDAVLLEWGLAGHGERSWPGIDRTSYGRRLLAKHFRTTSGRYSQLIDDIRNDTVRVEPFVATARRVLDMDGKRKQSIAYVSGLGEGELKRAKRRIVENSLVVAWVNRSMHERAAGYQYALERMVLDAPSPTAVEAERALTRLRQQIAAARMG
jgi:hypothetical protein